MNLPNRVFDYPEWSIDHAQQTGLLYTACVMAVLSLAYASWLARRERSAWPLCVFLGAACSVIYEPLGDILTKVAYPPLEQISLMTSFGRPLPLWMLPNYAFFFCVPVLLLLQFVIRADVTPRKGWLAYAGIVLFVALFEQPGINGDLWRYYAPNQAFSINSYPVWVGFANAQSLFIIAAGVLLLRQSILHGARTLLLVPMVPILFVGSHVGATLPVAWALYTSDDPLLVNAMALLAIGQCVLMVWIALQLVRGAGVRLPP